MISRRNRFHGYNSLNHVYRTGKSVRGEYLGLRYVSSKKPDYRLAVVVSKKVSKSAVVRNRLRRRIYETVRLHRLESDTAWPRDMIISIFDERAVAAPFVELETNVRQLMGKSGL